MNDGVGRRHLHREPDGPRRRRTTGPCSASRRTRACGPTPRRRCRSRCRRRARGRARSPSQPSTSEHPGGSVHVATRLRRHRPGARRAASSWASSRPSLAGCGTGGLPATSPPSAAPPVAVSVARRRRRRRRRRPSRRRRRPTPTSPLRSRSRRRDPLRDRVRRPATGPSGRSPGTAPGRTRRGSCPRTRAGRRRARPLGVAVRRPRRRRVDWTARWAPVTGRVPGTSRAASTAPGRWRSSPRARPERGASSSRRRSGRAGAAPGTGGSRSGREPPDMEPAPLARRRAWTRGTAPARGRRRLRRCAPAAVALKIETCASSGSITPKIFCSARRWTHDPQLSK